MKTKILELDIIFGIRGKLSFHMNSEEHRLENLEPEPGEPRLEILEA